MIANFIWFPYQLKEDRCDEVGEVEAYFWTWPAEIIKVAKNRFGMSDWFLLELIFD